MNLSLGERPVCWPVLQTIGPSTEITPSPALDGLSYSAAHAEVPMDFAGALQSYCVESDLAFTVRHSTPWSNRHKGTILS